MSASGPGSGPTSPSVVRARTQWRDLHGIVLLDKPLGMSSNQALQRARHRFRAAKGGHAGSLDPLATGMLPLCLGEATRLSGHLLGRSKAYSARARLGQTTLSGDAEGELQTQRPVPTLTQGDIEAVLADFRGRISQRPPAFSALHVDGQRAYQLARRGEHVELPEREVEIIGLELRGIHHEELELYVECGSGTYIRSLVMDIGEALGCGAHVSALRRDWVDPFQQHQMVTLDEVTAMESDDRALRATLLPLTAAIPAMARLQIESLEDISALSQGKALPAVGKECGDYALIDASQRLLALGEIREDQQFHPSKVFMRSGIEPAIAEHARTP